ncbi:MAG: hypothetical protein H6644_19420 [Caldilineaceae bacterium]|nr:hypothetical protein [Caldilineaceae bacterium]
MTTQAQSGQTPFTFVHRADLYNLPPRARTCEIDLHGGFAVDKHAGSAIYYGMPGCGIMRIDADLQRQEIIDLPADLTPVNFHSTKIGEFDGKRRLILPANNDEKVVVLTLDGAVDFVLPRPVFEEYQSDETPYRPTDTVLVDDDLFIADGYGANFISVADINTRAWTGIFGGKSSAPNEDGKFATAHGINLNPVHHHLDIADRPSSRIQAHGPVGASWHRVRCRPRAPVRHRLRGAPGAPPAVIGCLPARSAGGRPVPIYIIDARPTNCFLDRAPQRRSASSERSIPQRGLPRPRWVTSSHLPVVNWGSICVAAGMKVPTEVEQHPLPTERVAESPATSTLRRIVALIGVQ